MKTRSLLSIGLLCLAGCNVFDKAPAPALPTAKAGQASPLNTAQSKVDTANAELERQRMQRDSVIKARVSAARTATTGTDFVGSELALVENDLSDVALDQSEFDAAITRKGQLDAGQLDAARKSYDLAATLTQKRTEQRAAARAATDAATAERNAAIRSLEAQLEQNRIANQRVVDSLNAKLEAEKRSFMKWVGRVLTGVAIVLVLVGGFLIYTGIQSGSPFKSIVKAISCFIGSGVLITLAIIINEPWFIPAAIICACVFVLAIGGYVWSEYHEAKEKKVLDNDATEAESTLTKIAEIVHEIPEDNPVFKQLSSKLDMKEKALILELRALAKRKSVV